MINYSLFVKEKLKSIIADMASRKDEFVKDPGKDFTRRRKLSFEETINFMLSMGGGSLNYELLEHFSYDPKVATSSAFIQQRDKLHTRTFQFLLNEFTHSFENLTLYQGYRLVAVDGSALKDKNVIVIADRCYESYKVFAHIEEKGWKYIIRVKDAKSRGIISSLDLPKTGEFDCQLTRILTRKQTSVIKSRPDIYKFMPNNSNSDYLESVGQTYYSLSFRVVRVKIAENNYQTLITNLEPEEFGNEHIQELYRIRWGIETSFRELKHTIGLVNLHSKKVECIMQEVFARMVMYNFCEIITLPVVIQQKSRKYDYQVNFSKAMSICRYFFKTLVNAHPPDIEALIQKYILPIRQGRTHPRKIRSGTFVSFNYRIA